MYVTRKKRVRVEIKPPMPPCPNKAKRIEFRRWRSEILNPPDLRTPNPYPIVTFGAKAMMRKNKSLSILTNL